MESTDLQILKLRWGDNLKSSIFKIILLTLILLVALIATFSFANFEEIIKNWSRYRCNPAFMPFASMAGYNATDNFKFCLDSIFGEKARELFAPLFAIIANFAQILKLMVDVTLGMRQMFSRFFLGMNSYIRNVRDRIQALMFQVRMSFMKLQNLMGRVYATLFSVVFMGMSAVTAGLNLSENSLVNFVLEFCFAPETPVRMADGQTRPIRDLRIGDALEGGKVTSVFVFRGTETPMVRIGSVHLSAEHLVAGPTGWLLAKEHPDAVFAESIPELICLNTDTHMFTLGTGLEVRDYDETEEAHVVKEAQALSEKALNSGFQKGAVLDYALGFSETAFVCLENQTWIQANQVKIGDRLYGGNEVVGLVAEECKSVCNWKGVLVSAAQLVEDKGVWKRAAHLSEPQQETRTLIQFLTRHVRPFPIAVHPEKESVWIRDYREAPLPEMEDCYREEVAAITNKIE